MILKHKYQHMFPLPPRKPARPAGKGAVLTFRPALKPFSELPNVSPLSLRREREIFGD